MTPRRIFVVELSVVALSKDDPLSVDLTMFPELPTATKVLFPKVTPQNSFDVGEVTVLKDEPLSVDLKMVPDSPTTTIVLFPDVTEVIQFDVGEVTEVHEFPESPTDTEVHVVPFDEVRMVDDSPTARNVLFS